MATNLWPNADLESGIADWNEGSSMYLAHSSTEAWEQTYSLRFSPAGNYKNAQSDTKSIVSESTQYTVSFYINPVAADTQIQFGIFDQGDNNLGGYVTSTYTADTWTRVTKTITTGAGDTGIYLWFQKNTGTDAYFYVDGIMVETGGSASAWVNYVSDIDVDQSPLGTLTVAGYDPTVTANAPTAVAQSPLGTLTIQGFDPTVGSASGWEIGAYIYSVLGGVVVGVNPSPGSLVIQGFNPTITATDVNVEVSPGLGTLQIVGNDPEVKVDSGLLPTLGTVAIQGYNPAVTATDQASGDNGIKGPRILTPLLLK